jgi:transposase InsO family protein
MGTLAKDGFFRMWVFVTTIKSALGRDRRESFNGRVRDELLNESLFQGLDHARRTISWWVNDYNTQRFGIHHQRSPQRRPQKLSQIN